MKILFIFALFCSTLAFSQDSEDIRFLETSDSINTPFTLPIDIDTSGKISILRDGVDGKFSLSPLAQFNYVRTTINYVAPITSKNFEVIEPLAQAKWIEVKAKKLEAGLGPSTELAKTLTLGLIPFKGAMQTTIKYKNEKEESAEKFSLKFTLPKTLSQIEEWTTKDQGTYQTYGGIQAHASVGIGVVNIGSGTFALRNNFVVTIKKKTASLVEVKISEEDLIKRQLTLGPIVGRVYSTGYAGKIFSSTFTFDMTQTEHHELYRLAIKGRLDEVQENLPVENQKVEWLGSEFSYYAGIPWVIGKSETKGKFNIEFDDVESEIVLKRIENKGMFLPLRNHTRLVWNREKVLTLFWSSEMKKTKGSTLEKRFFSLGRALGVEGFEEKPELEAKLGSTITQLGLGFTKAEIDKLIVSKVNEMEGVLKERCELLKLNCRKDANLKKLINEVHRVIKLPWKTKRTELGMLITKNPVIVYGMIKTLKLKKEVFFKFLSERFQSIQGVTVVEL